MCACSWILSAKRTWSSDAVVESFDVPVISNAMQGTGDDCITVSLTEPILSSGHSNCGEDYHRMTPAARRACVNKYMRYEHNSVHSFCTKKTEGHYTRPETLHRSGPSPCNGRSSRIKKKKKERKGKIEALPPADDVFAYLNNKRCKRITSRRRPFFT